MLYTGTEAGATSGTLPIRGVVDEPVQSVTVNGQAARVTGTRFEGAAAVLAGTNSVTISAKDLGGGTDSIPAARFDVIFMG